MRPSPDPVTGGDPPRARPPLALLRGTAGAGATLDLALSHAVLDRVAAKDPPANGRPPAAIARLYRPGPTVAFGRFDTLRPGIAAAVAAAGARGFEPALRAPGGRVAAYHHRSVVLEVAAGDPDPRRTIDDRFARLAGLVVEALGTLGVAATVGELPDEYCPGAYSILAGGIKLGGFAQRVVRGAALVSIALVVEDGEPVREVLRDVSAHLDYRFDPATAGALDEVVPGLATGDVEAALGSSLAGAFTVASTEPDPAILAAAVALEPGHRLG